MTSRRPLRGIGTARFGDLYARHHCTVEQTSQPHQALVPNVSRALRSGADQMPVTDQEQEKK
jgi:hypothetical protein